MFRKYSNDFTIDIDEKKSTFSIDYTTDQVKKVSEFLKVLKRLKDVPIKLLNFDKNNMKASFSVGEEPIKEFRLIKMIFTEDVQKAISLVELIPSLIAKAKFQRAREIVDEVDKELDVIRQEIDREESFIY